MRLALAQVPHPASFDEGLRAVSKAVADGAEAGASLVCLPECCLKGMRGTDYPAPVTGGNQAASSLPQSASGRPIQIQAT